MNQFAYITNVLHGYSNMKRLNKHFNLVLYFAHKPLALLLISCEWRPTRAIRFLMFFTLKCWNKKNSYLIFRNVFLYQISTCGFLWDFCFTTLIAGFDEEPLISFSGFKTSETVALTRLRLDFGRCAWSNGRNSCSLTLSNRPKSVLKKHRKYMIPIWLTISRYRLPVVICDKIRRFLGWCFGRRNKYDIVNQFIFV